MVSSTNYNMAINPNISSTVSVSNTLKTNPQAQKTEVIEQVKNAKIKYRKIKRSDKYSVYGEWSEDYVDEVTKEITSSPELTALRSKYKLITFKNPISKSLYLKSCYKIDLVEAPQRYKGAGTKAVQSVVERSLADNDTQGRVVLNAEIIDGKSAPAGFFYKLGFRFIDKNLNDKMEDWVRQRTILNAPQIVGMMYLPKENIAKLMRYNGNLL